MKDQDTVYVTYIAATAEAVWEALTNSKFTAKYFFGSTVESDWVEGSPFRLYQEGRLDIDGVVLESDRPRRLAVSWLVAWDEELRKRKPDAVTYQLDDLGGVVRLTMTESHAEVVAEEMLEGGRRGWPMILSGLKSLLETGNPLPPFDPKF